MPDTSVSSAALAAPPAPPARQHMGIIPRTLDEVWRVATASCRGGLAPRFGNDPARVAAIMMAGLELNLPPMASLRLFYCTPDGQPALMVRGMLAVVQGRGLLEHWQDELSGEGEERAATVTLQRRGYPRITRTFSLSDARRAQLVGRKGDMYGKYLDRMLLSRAMSFALNDQFADILGGLYDPSELGGPVLDEDGTELFPPCAPAIQKPVEPPPAAKPPLMPADFWRRPTLSLEGKGACTADMLIDRLLLVAPQAPTVPLLEKLFAEQPATLLQAAMESDAWDRVEAARRARWTALMEESADGNVA